MNKMNKNRGFTLIELLVVIAIIGLIASIVVVALQGPRREARDAKRQGDIRNIATAQELCFPDAACGAVNAYFTSATTPASIPGYIVVMPRTPEGTAYSWVDNTGNNQRFCVFVRLEAGGWFVGSHAGVFVKASAPSGATPAAMLASCETPA
jgi:prepilin-type N-terminal cleavage/methylation domain-containing protein